MQHSATPRNLKCNKHHTVLAKWAYNVDPLLMNPLPSIEIIIAILILSPLKGGGLLITLIRVIIGILILKALKGRGVIHHGSTLNMTSFGLLVLRLQFARCGHRVMGNPELPISLNSGVYLKPH